MPELPEVEVIKNSLQTIILNQSLSKIIIRTSKLRNLMPTDNTLYVNSVVSNVTRKGKYLIFNFANDYSSIIHFGMSGHFVLVDDVNASPTKHDHLLFCFKEFQLFYRDQRKFGFFKFLPTKSIQDESCFQKIGVDLTKGELNSEAENKLFTKIKKTQKEIKVLLLDQSFISGVGNIYASEVLFLTKIDPRMKACDITMPLFSDLIFNIRKVLLDAIASGGTNFRNFYTPTGNTGTYNKRLLVYGRAGEQCFQCNKKISSVRQANRSTFFCDQCQIYR